MSVRLLYNNTPRKSSRKSVDLKKSFKHLQGLAGFWENQKRSTEFLEWKMEKGEWKMKNAECRMQNASKLRGDFSLHLLAEIFGD